jgi:hypothetical protein
LGALRKSVHSKISAKPSGEGDDDGANGAFATDDEDFDRFAIGIRVAVELRVSSRWTGPEDSGLRIRAL